MDLGMRGHRAEEQAHTIGDVERRRQQEPGASDQHRHTPQRHDRGNRHDDD